MIPKKFKTQFDERPHRRANAGSRLKILYVPKFNDNGQLELVENGVDDFYAYIQSHADSVDINVLLKRFMNGETDVLSRVQGVFGDFTGLPRTYAELLNSVNDGHQLFDTLPVEVRARFHHNFGEFMAAMDRPDFFELLGVKNVAPASDDVKNVDVKKDEVTSSES